MRVVGCGRLVGQGWPPGCSRRCPFCGEFTDGATAGDGASMGGVAVVVCGIRMRFLFAVCLLAVIGAAGCTRGTPAARPSADPRVAELRSEVASLRADVTAAEQKIEEAEAEADEAEAEADRLRAELADVVQEPAQVDADPEPTNDPATYRLMITRIFRCLAGTDPEASELRRYSKMAAEWDAQRLDVEARLLEEISDREAALIDFHREQSANAGREVCYDPFEDAG